MLSLDIDIGVDLSRVSVDTGPFSFGPKTQSADLAHHAGSMLAFTKYTKADYRDDWFHRVLCEKLDRWVEGHIKRLMVFMPPRYGKSELVSRRLPAYIFGKHPKSHIIGASYAADLARRMNLDVQRIIDDDSYRHLFPRTRLGSAKDDWTRTSDLFEIADHGGMYRSAGVGGAITGMGMHYGIIDDPVKNRKDASSPVVSQAVYDWYTSTFRTRSIGDASILLTVTRWDDDDLAGRLLELAENDPDADQWEVLKFPAICDGSGSEEDTREEGQALWPSMYDEKSLAATRASVGESDWASLYQQSPVAAGGNIYKSHHFDIETGRNRYHVDDQRMANAVLGRYIYFDTAFKDADSNDYSVGSVFEILADYRVRLRHVWRDKIESSDLPFQIESMAHQWNHDDKLKGIVIEDKGSGTTAIQTLRNSAPPAIAALISEFTPVGSKTYRGKQATVWCEKDCVLLPYPDESIPWYQETIDPKLGELFKFPNAKHDDFADTFSMGIIHLENIIMQGWNARNAQSI